MKNFLFKNAAKIIVALLLTASFSIYYFLIKDNRVELSKNPTYLISKNFNSNNFKLYGVGLGDYLGNIENFDSQKIKNESISAIMEDGLVLLKGGGGYRIVDGYVWEVGLSGPLIERSGLFREEDVLIKFGKPDKLNEEKSKYFPSKTYIYIEKGLIINTSDKGIESIIITSKSI